MSHPSKVMSMDLTQKEKHVMKRFLKELERAENWYR